MFERDWFRDVYGNYQITFEYVEPDNNKTYQFRKYIHSEKLKSLGGCWALCCVTDNQIKFYRSEYLRDRAYSKFTVEGGIDFTAEQEQFENAKANSKRYYKREIEIDREKLTESEFKLLRELIKKGQRD